MEGMKGEIFNRFNRVGRRHLAHQLMEMESCVAVVAAGLVGCEYVDISDTI